MSEKTPEKPLVYRPIEADPLRRGQLELHPRARFTKLSPEARKHVAATEARIERYEERRESIRTLREDLNTNAELSALGRARKVRASVDELLALLSKEEQALQVGESLHREKQAKLTAAPAIERGDTVKALLDMELRGYLRSLAAGERSKLVNDPDVAPEIVEAVLRAPAVLSDVGAEAWSRLQQKVRMARHGPELAKLEAEGVAIAAWREAIDLIRSDVKRAVEVAEHEATAPEKPAA